MLERITKTINIDNSRSHRNGLLPFVYYNGNNTSITEVTEHTVKGNYGGYVCDIVLFKEETIDEEKITKEFKRLKYLDINSKYTFIQNQIKNGVFVKKYKFDVENITYTDCQNKDENGNPSTKTDKVTEIRWRDTFDEISSVATYDFQPLDITYFKKKNDYYIYTEPLEYAELSARKDDEENPLTDEEKLFVEKIEKHNKVIDGDIKFALLISNYDEVMAYNRWWNEWWGDKISEFFNDYEEYKHNEDFKFCSDVDTYVIGRIEVILSVDIFHPNFVYYTEIKDRISKETEETDYLKFLQEIKPKWQKKSTKVEWDDEDIKYFLKYCPPEVTIEAIINSEEENEAFYLPYEYSIINNVKEYVVSAYTVDNNTESALKPFFKTFDENEIKIKTESQLQSLIHPKAQQVYRDIFGVYEEFDGDGGQMFECTLMEEKSTQPYVEYWCKGERYTYIFKDGKKVDEKFSYSIPPHFVKQPQEEVCAKPSSGSYVCYTAITDSTFEETVPIKDEVKDESGKTIYYYWSAITHNVYQWWNCKEVERGDRVCANGEFVASGSSKKYRNVTIVSCIKSLEPNAEVGGTYWVLARFKNGNKNPDTICSKGDISYLNIPYEIGVPLNVVSFDDEIIYDVVEKIEPNTEEGFVEITYVKGKVSGSTEDTGIRYKDTIIYQENFEIIPIDGVYPAELYYKKLDVEASKKTIYSEEYNLKRKVLRSEILGMDVGTQWTENGATSAMLITKEGSEDFKEEPKYNINLLFNRGNAAAWENHFKLSECNTMEDLENYGNNFFNL
jgi:hypothetical protein